jgi:hypothetical protein
LIDLLVIQLPVVASMKSDAVERRNLTFAHEFNVSGQPQ